MRVIKTFFFSLSIGILSFPLSCGDGGGINQLLFPVEKDVELGAQVAAEIEANPSEFPILSETEYPEAYSYLSGMMTDILSSNAVEYRDLFAYDEFKIIHQDEVLNAFATPGGYIYVYTGLIKFLDNADDLAGVLGHEVAHAERRHAIEQLKKNLTVQFLISIVAGEGTSEQIAALLSNLLSLQFSRNDESEADEYSVIYLAESEYACNGAATFFQKLVESGSGGGPAFLSTHPAPDTRVEDINAKAEELSCSTAAIEETGMTYTDFKNSLPQ